MSAPARCWAERMSKYHHPMADALWQTGQALNGIQARWSAELGWLRAALEADNTPPWLVALVMENWIVRYHPFGGEEQQRLLNNTLVGKSQQLRDESRALLIAMARGWRTFIVIASIGLAIMLFVIEHFHIS